MKYFEERDYKKHFDEEKDAKQYSEIWKNLLDYYNKIETKSANQ